MWFGLLCEGIDINGWTKEIFLRGLSLDEKEAVLFVKNWLQKLFNVRMYGFKLEGGVNCLKGVFANFLS